MPKPTTTPAPVFTEAIEPYEALQRWENGKYKGAHFQTKTVWRRDGVVINEVLNPPIPLKDVKGSTLADVMGQVAADQAVLIEEQAADLAAKEAELAKVKAALANAEAATEAATEAYRILLASIPAANVPA